MSHSREVAWALVVASAAGCGRIYFDERDGGPSAAALVIEPTTARANLNSTVAFTARGGVPPYTFTTDLGEIDGAGVLWTASTPAVATVRVFDDAGASAAASVTSGGDNIYVAGGYNGASVAEVWRTTGGGSWELAGSLPETRLNGALVVFDERLFFMGGFRDQPDGIPTDTVWASSDGAQWTTIGALPERAAAQAVAVFRGRIWLGGGNVNGDPYPTTLWSSADGATWQVEAPLPIAAHGLMFAVHADQLWIVAGHEATGQSAALYATPDGATWTNMGAVPAAGEYHGVTVHAGRLWAAGGLGLNDRVVSTLDGTSWDEATPMPASRVYTHLLSYAGELWVVGGTTLATLHSPDGASWTEAAPMPVSRALTRAAQLTPR